MNVAVVVEDENADDPDLYGLYEGVPLPERDEAGHGQLPDRIAIYRRPLEQDFPDPAELEHEIRVTVLHELAHYFGFDEERIGELGLRLMTMREVVAIASSCVRGCVAFRCAGLTPEGPASPAFRTDMTTCDRHHPR